MPWAALCNGPGSWPTQVLGLLINGPRPKGHGTHTIYHYGIKKIHGSIFATHTLSIFFFFLCSVLYFSVRDTITLRDWLQNGGETLVFVGKPFERGFFDPNGSSEIGRFVGLWY